jgi:chromosomal replication initiator protein
MTESLSERWTRCKELLRHRLSEEDAATWLPPLQLASLSASRAVICGVPNSFFKNRIDRRFGPLVRQCLAEAFATTRLKETLSLELRVGSAAGAAPEPGEGASAEAARPRSGEREEHPGHDASGLSFSSCIEGEANAAALALAREVVRTPGKRFNPFYLAGGVGLGKSHLLRVIAAELARAFPTWKIVYRTAEQFTNEVVDGIRRKRMPFVREALRTTDALLLDDVQFLQVSQRSREELLHTFDALHDAGKQLVFSSDRFPAGLEGMEDPLRSRLEMGLVAELGMPDKTMRLALLEAKAQEHGMALPPESAQLLAERISTGFRQVEGAFVRVAAYAALGGGLLTPDFVARVAEPFFDQEPEPEGIPATGEAVLGIVCDHFGITVSTLRSRSRTARLSKARRVAVYLLHEVSGLSYPEIGAALGNRTHSTIVYAMNKIRAELRSEPVFMRAVRQMRRELSGENSLPPRARPLSSGA